MSQKSFIYTGTLHHRRVEPKFHDFTYNVALFYLDLSEIESLFKIPFFFSHRAPTIAGFNRNDYLKGKGSLTEAVRGIIFEKTGKTHRGSVRLLTQIRYFGFCFNPVSFYYCFDESGKALEFIVAEITNTPWHEKRAYVLECDPNQSHHHFEFKKDFHVSPFMPMDLIFSWNFNTPTPDENRSKISVKMEDLTLDKNKCVFDAYLNLKPIPLTYLNLIKTVLGFPLLTLKSILAIYYQALCLKLKNVPFHSHPQKGDKL